MPCAAALSRSHLARHLAPSRIPPIPLARIAYLSVQVHTSLLRQQLQRPSPSSSPALCPSLHEMLRQALCRARSALAAVGPACGLPSPGAQLEAPTRALTSLLSLRGFTQQSWAAQAAGQGAAQAPAPPVAAAEAVQQSAAAAAAAAGAPPPPWTPTRELRKRKILPKRMQHLLTVSRRALLISRALHTHAFARC